MQGRQQFVSTVDLDPLGPIGAGHGGEIGGVALPIDFKDRPESGVEMRQFQSGNGAEGVVVHDHPDHRNLLFNGGGQHRRVLTKATITDQRNNDAIRAGQLGPDRGRGAKAHGGKAAGSKDAGRFINRVLLRQPVLVPAHVGTDDRITRQGRPQIGQDALRLHRPGLTFHPGFISGDEGGPVGGDGGNEFRTFDALRATLPGNAVKCPERLLEIGDGADGHRIVAPDLGRVDVDVNQLRRREVEGVFAFPGAAVRFGEASAQPQNPVGRLALFIDEFGAPEAGHAERQRVVVGQRALAHQGVGDRQSEVFGQFAHFVHAVGEHDPTTNVHQRIPGGEQLVDDLFGGGFVERRFGQFAVVGLNPLEEGDIDLAREHVHRHIDQHRAGPAAFGEGEGLFQNFREELRRVDPPDALAEGTVDFALRGVSVQVDLLVRVFAVVVARDIPGDDDQRDRVQRGVGHAGGGVGQPRREVREEDGGFRACPGVAVGRVGGNLLVTGVDELDLAALGECRQNSDIGVSAQAEQVGDAALFKITD